MSKEHPNPAENGKLTSEKITESLEYFAELRDLHFTTDTEEPQSDVARKKFEVYFPKVSSEPKKCAARALTHLREELKENPEKYIEIAIRENKMIISYPDDLNNY